MIPEAAVEAARTAIHRVSLDTFTHEEADVLARHALEAAAPHMLAEAWQDGATDGHLYGIQATNPYRSQA